MSQKIRVIYKLGDQYKLVMWVKLTSKFVMVAQTLLESHYQQFYPSGRDFHRHEIYFKNGDHHSSFKFFDEYQGLYIDRKIYADAIVILSSRTADFAIKCITKLPRDERNQDNGFVTFPLPPWTAENVGHAFSTLATRYQPPALRHFRSFDHRDFNPDNDILIDLNEHKDEIVNVTSSFHKLGNPNFPDLNGIKLPIKPIVKLIHQSDLTATVAVIFSPQKRSLKERFAHMITIARDRWFRNILSQ